MKRLLVLVATLALASSAFAGVQNFGEFSVDVPTGWTATKEDTTVGIVKNDNSAAVTITVDNLDGASPKEVAEAFVEAFKGTGLKEDNGVYTFDFKNDNGVQSAGIVYGDTAKGKFALLVATGAENAPEDVMKIIESLK